MNKPGKFGYGFAQLIDSYESIDHLFTQPELPGVQFPRGEPNVYERVCMVPRMRLSNDVLG